MLKPFTRGLFVFSRAPMSAIGPKQTWAIAPHMSAFGGKADIDQPGQLTNLDL